MNVLLFILQKEFRQIFRDKTILAIMFIMPTIQLIILPKAANFEVKNINLSVVDNDHSTFSQQLISKVGASGYFRITAMENSYKSALEKVEKNDADLVLEIPSGFERNLVREGQQQLAVSVDAINGTKAFLGGSYLQTIIADFNQNVRLKLVGPMGPVPPQPIIEVTNSNWFNPSAEYKFFMVPGILVLLLTLIGGFLSALNIVKEKEIGTIEQINVSPVKKWQFIVGKLVPFWVVGMVVFTVGLLVAFVVYGIVPAGSIPVLYLFAAVYLVALLGFGLLISTYSETQVQAMFVAFFFIMVFILMSGLFTPTDSMPAWAKVISELIPVTHFIRVMRMIVLKGSTFADVQIEFLYMVVFAVILNSWAIFNYRKTS